MGVKAGDLLGLVVFFTLITLHLHIAPYTKIEESFNIQASHDILTFGVPTNNASQHFRERYDHISFPGPVPRTFIGALLLSGLAQPILKLGPYLDRQFIVRLMLGCLNGLSLAYYAHRARKTFGRAAAAWYIALQASQFHVIYYASRTLPNMLAFPFTTTALSLLLPVAAHTSASNPPLRLAVFLLTTTAIVFRSEVAILLACHVTYTLAQRLWLNGRFEHIITLLRSSIIPAGVIAVIIGLSATIYIDTFFWQSPNYIWPELSAFFFNVFPQGDSIGASAWGTSPWHWYISNALPRLLLNPLLYVVLWFFGLWISATSRATLDLLAPNLAYVIVYSFLPHKESRFIFPVLPSLTLAGALPLSWIWIRRHKVYTYRIISAIAVLSVLACALVSNLVFLLSSSVSYPGADALNQLHEHILDHRSCAGYRNMANIKIHLDNLSIQTGITSFLERADLLTHFEVQEQDRVRHSMPTLVYDKSPIDPSSVWEYIDIDYVISEHPPPPQAAVPSSPDMEDYQWNVIATIYGLAGSRIHLLRAGQDTFHSPKYVPNRSSLPAARDESKNNNDDNADLELREAIDNRPGKDEENNGQSDNENKYWQSGVDALLVAMYDGSSVSVPSAPTARTRGRGQSRIEQASVFFRQFMRGGGGGGGGSSSSSRRPITTFHPPSPSSSSHFPTPKNGESPAAGGWERKSENDGRWPGLTSGWWVDVDWKVRLYVCERIRRPQ